MGEIKDIIKDIRRKLVLPRAGCSDFGPANGPTPAVIDRSTRTSKWFTEARGKEWTHWWVLSNDQVVKVPEGTHFHRDTSSNVNEATKANRPLPKTLEDIRSSKLWFRLYKNVVANNGVKDLYPGFGISKNPNEKHTLYASKKEAEEMLVSYFKMLHDLPEPIPVWRVLRIESGHKKDIDKGRGVSWSYTEQGAREFGAYHVSRWNYILHGVTPSSNVDWEMTVWLNSIEGYADELRIKDPNLVKKVTIMKDTHTNEAKERQYYELEDLPSEVQDDAYNSVPEDFEANIDGRLVWYYDTMGREEIKQNAKAWRKQFLEPTSLDTSYLDELKADIKRSGMHNPPVLGPGGIEGNHRIYVAYLLKLPKIQVVRYAVLDDDDNVIQETESKPTAAIDPFMFKDDCSYEKWRRRRKCPKAESVHEILSNIRSLMEEPPPRDVETQATWYHGSPKFENAMHAFVDGIKPHDIKTLKDDDLIEPRAGVVYLTKRLDYAIRYCVRTWFGQPPSERSLQKWGRYAGLLVVPGSALTEVEPDEDDIGMALMDEPERFPWLRELAKKHLDPKLYEKVMGGDISYLAMAGKQLVGKLSQEQMYQIMDRYPQAAAKGVIKPSELWRFDRNLMPQLKEDGSNFFELAKKIGGRP